MTYVYVKIPTLEDFRNFLISHAVHEYAVVQRKTGGNIVRYFYRLTANLANREEIAVCDINFWQGLDLEFETKLEQVNQKKDAKWTEIEKIMAAGEVELPGAEDKTRKMSWHFTVIDAEYSATLE
jgi:hypothetical protein